MSGGCVCQAPPVQDCGGSPRCVDTATSLAHCGACGAPCARANGACQAGLCTCVAPRPDYCPAVGPDGTCTSLATDLANCGACGAPCNRANGACQGGSCTCPASRPDFCPGVGPNGTCTQLATDLANCGSCGVACTRAAGVCQAGVCGCAAPRPDYCPTVGANGSCLDLATDPAHCGACGRACGSGQVCAAGACRTPCCPVSTACCAGGTSCCPGGCPVAHSNGVPPSAGGPQAYFDCLPVGDHSPESQRRAADAWRTDGNTNESFPCGGQSCLMRQTADACALWCPDGTMTISTPLLPACLCPLQAPTHPWG